MSKHVDNKFGKIESVYCKNFVTYEECIFHPNEHLNVVIGPNGTGKSTMVAAIMLGLGGEPKLLSRAQSIKSYIKNGRESALIIITIYGNNSGRLKRFQRSFGSDGKSEFKINEEPMPRSKFIAGVAEYNIQIGNPCQFLPQDRVQDFAKMNPQEILHNTLISACNETVVENFAKLKEMQKSGVEATKNLQTNGQKLQETIKRVDELQLVLQTYRVRQEYVDKLGVCEAKISWLMLDDIKKKTCEYVKDLKLAQKSYDSQKTAHEELMRQGQAITEITTTYKNDAEQKQRAEKNVFNKKTAICEQIDALHRKITDTKRQHEAEKHLFKERQQERQNEGRLLQLIIADLDKAKEEIDSERTELQRCEGTLEKFRETAKKYKEARSKVNAVLDDEYTPELQMIRQRISRVENVKEQKLQLLKRKFQDQYAAVQWLRAQGDIFKGRVYDPMILELNMRDPSYAKYLENTVPMRDLLAFTCESKADVSLLISELCTKRNLKVSVVYSPAAEQCLAAANEPIPQKFGFHSYLLDLIEGPPAILNYLCSLYKIHFIPIGSHAVASHTDAITHNFYFGGDLRYTVCRSKYGNNAKLLLQSTIFCKNLLSSVDMSEVQRLKKRFDELVRKSDDLKNKRTQLEAKINEIEHNFSKVTTERRNFQKKIAVFETLKQKVQLQNQKINRLTETVGSIPEMEQRFGTIMKQCLEKVIELQKQKIETLKLFQRAIIDKEYAQTKLNLFNQQNENLQRQIAEANTAKLTCQHLLTTIERTLSAAKQEYQNKLTRALKKTNNVKPTDKKYVHMELYASLPNTKDELGEAISDANARLECLADVDANVIAEHTQKSAEIEELKRLIAQGQHEDNDLQLEVQTIYNNWYPEIERVVESLNRHFSDFMESMQYVGEVLLARKNERDFDSYGLQIMVQYRSNVPLQALDRNVQSGGERAVAIAMYTLSMQHLTHVPFRCVDEINQGMDPRNERKVFDMLVRETTKRGRSQYFFITPKLLSDLHYNERMSVHIVFNGTSIHQNDFSV